MIVDVVEAQKTLLKLIGAALEGEEVIIADGGIFLVRLESIVRNDKGIPGRFAGEVEMGEFFDPLEEKELEPWVG